MKVFVSHNPLSLFDFPADGELMMFSLYHNDKDNSMLGVTSGNFNHSLRIADLNISEDFLRDIIKQTIEFKYKAKFKDANFFEVMSLFHYKLSDIISNLLEKAKDFEDGDLVEIYGKEVKKIQRIEGEFIHINKQEFIKEIEKLYANNTTGLDKEIDAYNSGIKKVLDYIIQL